MIRHVVLVRFREAVSATEIAAIFQQLDDLRQKLAGMKVFCHGSNVSPEGLARGYTHAFTVDFIDAAARDAYLAHPDHEAAGARLVKAAEGGLSGLLVLDFALEQEAKASVRVAG